jgi:gas vesicle protein
MTTGTKVFIGILGAAAVGVVVGLLVAPDKGSETRKRIAETTGDWADQVNKAFKKTRNQFDELKHKAKSMKAAAAEKANNLQEDLG